MPSDGLGTAVAFFSVGRSVVTGTLLIFVFSVYFDVLLCIIDVSVCSKCKYVRWVVTAYGLHKQS